MFQFATIVKRFDAIFMLNYYPEHYGMESRRKILIRLFKQAHGEKGERRGERERGGREGERWGEKWREGERRERVGGESKGGR